MLLVVSGGLASGVGHTHTAHGSAVGRGDLAREVSGRLRETRIARRRVVFGYRFARLAALASVDRVEVCLGFYELLLLALLFVAEHVVGLVLSLCAIWHDYLIETGRLLRIQFG